MSVWGKLINSQNMGIFAAYISECVTISSTHDKTVAKVGSAV
jgi:hypothetical protein